MLSNPTYFDSTAHYEEYINKALELGMSAIAFTEHGNAYQWISKKLYCDEKQIKYIHASEFYMARDLEERKRENFHINLYALNYDGVKELNRLSSLSYEGKGKPWEPGTHYYYRPRLSMDEVMQTSDNIAITTACLASMLWRERISEDVNVFLKWMQQNKHRCFLEIQPHDIDDQREYNKLLYKWSKEYGIRLIAGTDTHVLNKEDAKLRRVLQQGKRATAEENEDGFNLHFRNYDELVTEFIQQGALRQDVIYEALNNTNILADMCDNWQLDMSHKYPKISANPQEELWKRIQKGALERGIYDYEPSKKQLYLNRIKEEYETFVKVGMCDYIILLDEIISFCKQNNISTAPRGSCNGSLTLWAMGITDIDSIRFNLHFFRFVNPHRISLGDVDIDMAGSKRPLVKDFLYTYPNINGSAIITYQTLALRGAVRLVAKGLGYDLATEDMVAKDIEEQIVENDYGEEKRITTFNNRETWMQRYPEWIELAEQAMGIIENSSTHACGFVVTDRAIEEEIGVFNNGDSPWVISQNDMSAIEAVNFVKMDLLTVDNVQIIEDTCRIANIPMLQNDELNFEDNNVWGEMKKSGLGIFQFEKSGWYSLKTALDNYKQFKQAEANITRFDIMLALNGVIRPACDSFRQDFLQGKAHDNGHEAINQFLAPTLGYCIFQEQIMQFLTLFCHYSEAESDSVRRGIAQKGNTEKFLPEIESRFIKYMSLQYDLTKNDAKKLVEEFLTIVLDASNYGFSTNHSCPYTILGFKGAYLRHYYPLEFLTTQLNINDGNIKKTNNIVQFIREHTQITIKAARFRFSSGKYMFDKPTNTIYKGIGSIKFISEQLGEELYALRNNQYNNFIELLYDINNHTSCNSRELEILIRLNYFSEFGKSKKLLTFIPVFNGLYKAKAVNKGKYHPDIESIISRHSRETPSQYRDLDNMKIMSDIWDTIPDTDFSIIEQVVAQKDYLGYIDYTNDKLDKRYIMVLNLNTRYSPRFTAYCLNNGKTEKLKVYRTKKGKRAKQTTYFSDVPFEEGDILYARQFRPQPKSVKTPDGWEKIPNSKEWWLIDYVKVEQGYIHNQ